MLSRCLAGHRRDRARSSALLFATLLACCFGTGARGQSLNFSQLSLNLDDGSHPNSDWGAIDMSFIGSSAVEYLNVTVNGSWQIQNVPVLSDNGSGVSQTNTYNFAIGPNGVPYSGSLAYGFTLTPAPSVQPVQNLVQATVPSLTLEEHVGEQGGANAIQYAVAGALVGAAAGATTTAKAGPNFPNQEAGVDECVPVAVSNSLQYLNARFNLGMAPVDITIAKMKIATGWDADGAPVGWWNTKDAYMKANKLPITTTATTDIATAMSELTAGCDVELGSPNHRAAVVGITKLANGKYSIDVAHDTKQGVAGGTKTETVSYDPTTGKLSGATFFNNVDFRNFVIECPVPEPATIATIAIGLIAAVGVRRRRSGRAAGRL